MDGPDPRIAVVMITHDRREEVIRSLEHLTSLPERPRIVIVDNASTDGTRAILARLFPSVEVLDAGGNLGAAARTLGVRHVTEPYVALCDDDTWWEPGSLRRAADLFDSYPRLTVLTARVLVGPQNREDPVCAELEHGLPAGEPNLPGTPILGFLAGASVVRRSAFLEVGGFDPRFFIGGEEELVAADLAARGWALRYVADLVVHHYPSPQRDGLSRRWHLTRNALWFAWLRRPLPNALHQTLDLVRTALHDRARLRGFAAALAGLPWVLRERRVLPPGVEHRLRQLDARRHA
jgi:GT2 family glycosyltransferase